jgi:hypothetical protein
MKRNVLILTLSVLLVSITTRAQNFEGKIVYQNSYKSKIPNMPDERFSAMMGSTQEFLIKGNNYKSIMNGSFLQWQLYLSRDNKLYTKMSNSDAIFYNDAAVNTDQVMKTELNKGVTEILGYKCDELIVTAKSGVQKFYFSPAIKIDAGAFEQHKFGNWSEVIEMIHSLPLKMVIDNPQFVLESTATIVGESILDDSIFTLPAGANIQKSPF